MSVDENLMRASDVCELSRLLGRGRSAAAQTLECSLSTIESSNPHLNAITVRNPNALEEAIALEVICALRDEASLLYEEAKAGKHHSSASLPEIHNGQI